MTAIKTLLAGAAALAVLSMAPLAQASVVYSNLNSNPGDADCSFNTTCAASVGRGDEFAAQAFSLGSTTTINSGAWTELNSGSSGSTSVNYAFYADGGSGVPVGAALFSGSAATSATDVGPGNFGLEVFRLDFNLGSIVLGAGNYFFAIQDVTANFGDYLGQGLVSTGAAETNDGGITWAPGYENGAGGDHLGGVSVGLFNTASGTPEPATWAMMLMGFGGLGAMLRRRRGAAALA